MTKDEATEILCDAVHGTLKGPYLQAQEEGMSPELWDSIVKGAVNAMQEAYTTGWNDAGDVG